MLRPLLAFVLCSSLVVAAEGWPNIPRKLPPVGKEVPEADAQRLRAAVDELRAALGKQTSPLTADVAVFTKAVDLALRHREFYDLAKDLPKADWALAQARERLDKLKSAPWTSQRGGVVRGYVSSIDDSVQPYGLVIPDKLDLGKACPLYVWLHGRGDNDTDLHFIKSRGGGGGDIKPGDGIVLHVFGRQCVGFKSAGEIDVLEAIAHVQSQYKIDPDRVALMGFSMGGAGAKHLGAHYADHWAVMHAGAGFAETRRYLNLKIEETPPWEATLWGLYDSPDYVRNLFNIPVIAYSGEEDSQMKAGIILGEAYEAHGKKLEHLIAPKTGHKYHPDYLKQVMAFVTTALAKGRNTAPEQVYFQTKTLRYAKQYWVEALGLGEHWKDARVDALADAKGVTATTSNITRLRMTWPKLKSGSTVTLDGQALKVGAGKSGAVFERSGETWALAKDDTPTGLHKTPGLQGPIDDAFMSRFLIVLPSKPCADAAVDTWVKNESAHQRTRWSALMRGEARVKQDSEVTAEDIASSNLILWGDATANSVIAKVLSKLPVQWDGASVTVGTKKFDGAQHVPACIYPNPLNPAKYVVLNSGLTFREAHDKTNSQQNPKLPDWAVIDIRTPPSDTAPGKIADAGFFDERWAVK
jgi:predicted esterase